MNAGPNNALRRSGRPASLQQEPRLRRPRRRHLLAWACVLALGGTGAAQADAVTEWNAFAGAHTPLPLPVKLRAMAMVQIAVHDALNSIDPRFRTYTAVPGAAPDALPAAAVAAASRAVLEAVAPGTEAAAIASEYAARLQGLPGCQAPVSAACQAGIDAGEGAAAAILAARTLDGAQNPPHLPYTLGPAPGVYQPTPGMPGSQPAQPAFPAFANWANVTPFALQTSRQFRAGTAQMLKLASTAYAADYEEVRSEGAATVRAAAPDSYRSRVARFWYGSAGSDWAANARAVVDGLGLDPWQHARLFALLAIGQADVTVSVFDNKYHYNFWRPVTAIRWADDGNPATTSDPDWQPYLVTPPYPDYPCGTPMLAGAGTEVLRRVLGSDDIPFALTSNFAQQVVVEPLPSPGKAHTGVPAGTVTFNFDSLSQAADQSADARVWAGIHFRTGCEVGVEQGRKIGRHAAKHYLRPL